MVEEELCGHKENRNDGEGRDQRHSPLLGWLERAEPPLGGSGATEPPTVEEHPEIEESNAGGESEQGETNGCLMENACTFGEHNSRRTYKGSNSIRANDQDAYSFNGREQERCSTRKERGLIVRAFGSWHSRVIVVGIGHLWRHE
jgi:hypothetical protein